MLRKSLGPRSMYRKEGTERATVRQQKLNQVMEQEKLSRARGKEFWWEQSTRRGNPKDIQQPPRANIHLVHYCLTTQVCV